MQPGHDDRPARLDVVGFDRQGGLEATDGLIDLVPGPVDIAQADIRFGELAIERQRLAQGRGGGIEPAIGAKDISKEDRLRLKGQIEALYQKGSLSAKAFVEQVVQTVSPKRGNKDE